MNSKLFLPLFICTAFLGALSGGIWAKKEIAYPNHRGLASADLDIGFANTYDEIPCVSEVDYQKMVREFNIKNTIPGSLCDDSIKSRLAKALWLANQLKVDTTWPGPVRDALKNPYLYIKNHALSIDYDADQVGSTAYNQSKNFFLGKSMQTSAPIEFIALLVHEGRHSADTDPGHVNCKQGTRIGLSQMCDENFNFTDKSGAYSVTVGFLYGMANHAANISPLTREYLKNSALSYLGSTFNTFANDNAGIFETIALLNQAGKAFIIHPFTKELIPIDTPFSRKVARISSNFQSNGVNLFYEDQSIQSWTPDLPTYSFYTTQPENSQVVDVENITFSAGHSMASYYGWSNFSARKPQKNNSAQDSTSNDNTNNFPTIDGCGLLKNIFKKKLCFGDVKDGSFLTETFLKNNGEIFTNDQKTFDLKVPNAKRLIAGPMLNTYVLDEVGNLFLTSRSNNQITTIPSSFSDPESLGWNEVTSSILKDTLFAVNSNHKAYVSQINLETKEMKPLSFEQYFPPLPNGAFFKIQETYNYIISMDTTGNLYIMNHGDQNWRILHDANSSTEKFVNFAVISSFDYLDFVASKGSASKKSSYDMFVSKCKIISSSKENWLKRAVGFNQKQEIVFEGKNNTCKVYPSILSTKPRSSNLEIKMISGENKTNRHTPPKIKFSVGEDSISLSAYQ